jgi:hypothetical protein
VNRASVRIAGVLVLLVLVAYAAPLFGGETFVGRDHLTHTIPAKTFLADSLRAGHVPEWWPAVDLGVPFAANPNHSALYPPMWLVAILPMPWAVDFVLVLHVLFGALGLAALARRFGATATGAVVGAGVFALAGFVPSTVVHGGPLVTLAWLPWIAWAADRVDGPRRAVVLAMVVAGALLAGDPSFVLIGAWLAVGVVLCRNPRRIGYVLAALTAAVALAAIVVLPAMYLAADSARAHGISSDTWSLHPLRLLEVLWPDILGDPNHEASYFARDVANAAGSSRLSPGWALSVYMSLPAVVLAVAGSRRHKRLAIVAIAFIVIALGRYTPLYAAYRFLFLPEHFVRYPEKYLAGALVIGCVLAAVGWTSTTRRAWITAGVLAVIAAGVFLAVVNGVNVDGVAHAKLQALVAVVVFIGVATTMRWPALAASVLLLFVVTRTWSTLPTFDRDVLAHPPQIVAGVAPGTRIARPTEHRVRPDDSLPAQARTLYEGAVANVATRFGLRYFIGYDQGHTGTFEQRARELQNEAAYRRFGVQLVIVGTDEVGARHVLATDAPYGPYALVENPGARPRAFVGDLPCTIVEHAPESVDVTCDAAAPGTAVLLDSYAAGWTATVDGAPTPIERVDDLVRGVHITTGHHVIAYRYETPGLRLGALLALLAWLAAIGYLLIRR